MSYFVYVRASASKSAPVPHDVHFVRWYAATFAAAE